MRRFLNGCGKYRASICLLAGGGLEKQDLASLESHLANCSGCRGYYDEVKSVAAALANWERTVCHVEPNQTVQARWAKDFQAATGPNRAARPEFILSLLDWCRDLFWPCRRVWAGFAAIWMGIFAADFSTRDTAHAAALKRSSASPEAVRAYLEREGLLVELHKPAKHRLIEASKPPIPPPRSERRPRLRRV